MWTRFMDMHSGGGQKLDWAYIFIEAPEEEAKKVFYALFGRNPEKVTCTCCGEDYSITEEETLEQGTAYERNCEYDKAGERYLEEQCKSKMAIRKSCNTPDSDPWGLYIPFLDFVSRPEIKVVIADEILPEHRTVEVPQQGYVWQD
jgi:hypothetical protein